MANLKTFADAKDWVMVNTRDSLALLASDMGYAWPMGTKGFFPGDNMLLDGDKWISDTTGPQTGPKPLERLVIKYGDWKLKINDLKFDEAQIEHMEPFVALTGNLINVEQHPATQTVKEEYKVTREVTNSNETSFTAGASVGASFTYEPPAGIGGSVNYKVSLEEGKTTTNVNGKTDITTLTIDTKKEVDPYSAVAWSMLISRTKATTKYAAKVEVSFSVEFQGYLRWGGAKGLYKNFHKDYSGSDARPTINYKFGSATKNFAEDLKDQSSQNKSPWLWDQMKQRYVHCAQNINTLCDTSNYKFDVAGKISDVQGIQANISYKQLPKPGSENDA